VVTLVDRARAVEKLQRGYGGEETRKSGEEQSGSEIDEDGREEEIEEPGAESSDYLDAWEESDGDDDDRRRR
jgi:hypothetical protein